MAFFSTDETLVSHPSPEMIHLYSVIILLPLHPSLLLVTRRIHFPWNRAGFEFFQKQFEQGFSFRYFSFLFFLQASTFGNATKILHTEEKKPIKDICIRSITKFTIFQIISLDVIRVESPRDLVINGKKASGDFVAGIELSTFAKSD